MEPITITIVVNAPIDKVWDYFTVPQHITEWYFASDDWHAPHAENDLQTGGVFKIRMAAKDGSFGFDLEGKYTDVLIKQYIAYELADARTVKISFEADGASTRVTEVFDPENTNPVEMQKGGWQAILDNFKKYTEGN